MENKAHALARDELIRVLTAYKGITTSDGEAIDSHGTTLIDSNLKGRNDFISGKTILIMSGDAKDEDKGAISFNSATSEITLQGDGFSAQIKAGTIFKVLNISSIEIDVAPQVMGRLQIAATTIDLQQAGFYQCCRWGKG
ncbi:unnamed protein product [marine sediment metagenome]|uniref:Uncharacterized protein n=1 Tax=marine sediment metagenome TaxID=412755 RepID=X1LXF8_9ZZZZ